MLNLSVFDSFGAQLARKFETDKSGRSCECRREPSVASRPRIVEFRGITHSTPKTPSIQESDNQMAYASSSCEGQCHHAVFKGEDYLQ
jgi:hypothetical protein